MATAEAQSDVPPPIFGPGPVEPRPWSETTPAPPPVDEEATRRATERDPNFKPKRIPGLGFAIGKTRAGSFIIEGFGDNPDTITHRDPPQQANLTGSASVNLPASFDSAPFCTQSGRRFYPVYAHPQGGWNNYQTYLNDLRRYLRLATGKVLQESYSSSGNYRAARPRMQCSNGAIQLAGPIAIPNARPPGFDFTPGWDDAQNVAGWVEHSLGRPTGSNARKYVIFYDRWGTDVSPAPGTQPNPGVGFAWFVPATANADVKSASNINNSQTSSSVLYPEYWHTHNTLHEMFHTLGAVQPSAPFATNGQHCIDGNDTMCYEDGTGPGLYADSTCGDGQYNPNGWLYSSQEGFPLDCNYNTYFKTSSSSSWLDSHWNVGGKEDGFMSYTPNWP